MYGLHRIVFPKSAFDLDQAEHIMKFYYEMNEIQHKRIEDTQSSYDFIIRESTLFVDNSFYSCGDDTNHEIRLMYGKLLNEI